MDFLEPKDVEVRFDGRTISMDAGLAVFIEWMDKDEVWESFVEVLEKQDRRDEDRTDHSLRRLLPQRVLKIVAGYEDANDSDELAKAPCLGAANEGWKTSRPTRRSPR